MPVFVSHSQKDSAIYTTLCFALDGAGIPRWDVVNMSAGDPLADQLRGAIKKCEVCIFLATRRSVESPWCLAEVGAFWGSGKKVLLFMADPDLTEAMLPPQFNGNLRVYDAAKLFAASREEMDRQASLAKPSVVEVLLESPEDYGTDKDWMELVSKSSSGFDTMGISLTSWRKTPGFTKLVKEQAEAGRKFRFLITAPENPVLDNLAYLARAEVTRESIVNSILESARYYQGLVKFHPNIEFRQLKSIIPYFSCMKTDQIAVLFVFTTSQMQGPACLCPSTTPLYRIISQEFDALWALGTPTVPSGSAEPGQEAAGPGLKHRKRS